MSSEVRSKEKELNYAGIYSLSKYTKHIPALRINNPFFVSDECKLLDKRSYLITGYEK